MRERSDLLDPVCEIELPGVGWRSSESRDDRDRRRSENVADMAREQQEGRGWIIVDQKGDKSPRETGAEGNCR